MLSPYAREASQAHQNPTPVAIKPAAQVCRAQDLHSQLHQNHARTAQVCEWLVEAAATPPMAEGRHGALHAQLTQMAAVLRVAKEREAVRSDGRAADGGELGRMRQECQAWHSEADHLWRQVQHLQGQLEEGAP